MSPPSIPPDAHWKQCTRAYVKTLPALDFPFSRPPDVYAPGSTVLRLGDGRLFLAFRWVYLRRVGNGKVTSYDATSLSDLRAVALPLALTRLSKWFQFKNARPYSISDALLKLGLLLSWADQSEHAGRFEAILGDSDIAFEALNGHHIYLRNRMHANQLSPLSAALREQSTIASLSEIHGRIYKDEIEPIRSSKGRGTKAPSAQAVAEFSSTLQAIFDSAAEVVLGERSTQLVRKLRVSAMDDSQTVELRASYGPLRLMDLTCMAFAGLAFVDTGANQSVLTDYEEPDDLEDQLAEPDRINLTQKAVKFRAGGKDVEVHLSATTITRLKTYLRVRQLLVTRLGNVDIAPMFIQCFYDDPKGEPFAVRTLQKDFLLCLRRKLASVGASLPNVTLRQLRVYKQEHLVRGATVDIAAKVMGHSVKTAIVAYCKAQEVTRRGEMAVFLSSLQKTILTATESLVKSARQKVIPVGICEDYGKPSPTDRSTVVAPDCSKVEGCFFCENYRLHADAEDMRKLMSCRRVLKYILPLNGDSIRAERVYAAVVDRIDALLGEIRRRQPQAFEAVWRDVEVHGQLTRYWSGKLQQLHLLGMLHASPM